MRIRNILMTGLLTVGLHSCEKAPIKEMSSKYISPIVTERVDSMAVESRKILKNPKYEKFANDTLELTKDFFKEPGKFIKKLNNSSAENIPTTLTGTYITSVPVPVGKSFVMTPQVHNVYTNNYINTRAVINSKKFFTRDNTDMYIPVEYYGIPNPKLKQK